MIYRKRTLGKCLSSKDSQTDVIIWTPIYKFSSYLFSSLQTVGFQIFSKHTG